MVAPMYPFTRPLLARWNPELLRASQEDTAGRQNGGS